MSDGKSQFLCRKVRDEMLHQEAQDSGYSVYDSTGVPEGTAGRSGGRVQSRTGIVKERREAQRFSQVPCFPPSIPSCLLESDDRREGLGLSGGASCSRDEPLVLGTSEDQSGPRTFDALISSKAFEFCTKYLQFLLEDVVGDKAKHMDDKVANSRPFDLQD